MALPSGKQVSDFKAIEPGNYVVELTGITLQVASEYKSDAYNDGDGLCYQSCTLHWHVDSDVEGGEEYRENFVKVSLHEKSKLYNRLAALYGQEIPADGIEWKLAKDIERGIALDSYYRSDGKDGNKKDTWVVDADKTTYDGLEGTVDDLLIDGVSVIGRECMLQIGVKESGYNTAKAGAAAVLPKRGRGKQTTAAEATQDETPAEPAKPARRAAPVEDDADDAPPPAPSRRRQAPAGAPT